MSDKVEYLFELIRSGDWINGTEVAGMFDKDVNEWAHSDYTREYAAEMMATMDNPEPLTDDWEGYVLIHPKLAIMFSIWCSTEFHIRYNDIAFTSIK